MNGEKRERERERDRHRESERDREREREREGVREGGREGGEERERGFLGISFLHHMPYKESIDRSSMFCYTRLPAGSDLRFSMHQSSVFKMDTSLNRMHPVREASAALLRSNDTFQLTKGLATEETDVCEPRTLLAALLYTGFKSCACMGQACWFPRSCHQPDTSFRAHSRSWGAHALRCRFVPTGSQAGRRGGKWLWLNKPVPKSPPS